MLTLVVPVLKLLWAEVSLFKVVSFLLSESLKYIFFTTLLVITQVTITQHSQSYTIVHPKG